MENKSFRAWCLIATGKIGFPPDRKTVRAELEQHMQDHYDALIEQGLSQEEATKMTLEAMGNAYEIAPQLAAIHKPFWGYYLRVIRIIAIMLLCISLLPIWNYIKDLQRQEAYNLKQLDTYNPDSYGGDTGRTLHHLSKPNLSFSSDGNDFLITDVALITTPLAGNIGERTTLHIQMKQTTQLPWTVQEQYSYFFTICDWFFARDSLGNFYPGGAFQALDNELHSSGAQSGFFTYTHQFWIFNFPVEAQWVDICYKRDGREFCLRVYLNGGDST